MIKIETVGMLDVAKINPVLKSESAVTNYDFITDNGIVYLVCNTIVGDNSYREDVVIPAGEFLNGYQVDAFAGQKLVVDGKHIKATYGDLAVDNILTINNAGKLVVAESAPVSGVYFKITEKTTLTEPAVKVLVCVA